MILRIARSLRRRIRNWTKGKVSPPSLSDIDWKTCPVSGKLLRAFPYFVPHQGASGIPDLHFQDRELGGAVACTPGEASMLYLAARAIAPRHALEIGSYMGWSSSHIASAIPGRLTCVEPFIEIGANLRETVSEPARERFLSNMKRAGVSEKIILVCGKSPEALRPIAPAGGWDFAFIDGLHINNQPLCDTLEVIRSISPASVVVLHDIWVRDVRDAALFLLADGFNIYVCHSANFLTFAWKGPIMESLSQTLLSAEWQKLTNPQSESQRRRYGLDSDALNQFARKFGSVAYDARSLK